MRRRQKIALIGDSVFDNAPYVGPGESVIELANTAAPDHVEFELGAEDGAIVRDVFDQIRDVALDTTDLFVSVGGNDALQNRCWVGTNKEDSFVFGFAYRYGVLCRALRVWSDANERIMPYPPTINLLTIYKGCPQAEISDDERAVIDRMNAAIIGAAYAQDFRVVRLDKLLTLPEHYAECSPIEPSKAGGWELVLEFHRRTSNSIAKEVTDD